MVRPDSEIDPNRLVDWRALLDSPLILGNLFDRFKRLVESEESAGFREYLRIVLRERN